MLLTEERPSTLITPGAPDYEALLHAAGIPTLRDEEPKAFAHLPQFIAVDGEFLPVPAGGAEEVENPLGTIGPITGLTAPSLQRLQITAKTLLRQLVLRMSGTYDQSVGAETQATEGNPVLIQQVRLNCDGRLIRLKAGGILYEENRIVNQGAGPKTDPAPGVANGKAFSCVLTYDMGFFDCAEVDAREDTYLDLSQFANVFLEIQFNAFSAYVSGNTQANVSYTVAVSDLEILGPRRLPQRHYEMQLVQTVDMSTTATNVTVPLNRNKTLIRGLLLRVGTLAATPVVTAITALTNVGVQGKLNKGAFVTPKQKQSVALYQATVGNQRNGIALTAGYLFIDFASNRSWKGMLVGDAYSDLSLIFDRTGTANTTMEVYQLCATR